MCSDRISTQGAMWPSVPQSSLLLNRGFQPFIPKNTVPFEDKLFPVSPPRLLRPGPMGVCCLYCHPQAPGQRGLSGVLWLLLTPLSPLSS
jgi:hypothetical protein